jgi:hypothetical protein
LGFEGFDEPDAHERPELKDAPFAPRAPPQLSHAGRIFDAIRKQDFLLYHRMILHAVVDFLRQLRRSGCAGDQAGAYTVPVIMHRGGCAAGGVWQNGRAEWRSVAMWNQGARG